MIKPLTGLYWPVDSPRSSILEHALRPIDLQVFIEPMTGDRIFLLQFEAHAPVAIRQTVDQVVEARMLLAQAEAATLH